MAVLNFQAKPFVPAPARNLPEDLYADEPSAAYYYDESEDSEEVRIRTRLLCILKE